MSLISSNIKFPYEIVLKNHEKVKFTEAEYRGSSNLYRNIPNLATDDINLHKIKAVPISIHDGHMWKCIDLKLSPNGGNIYVFVARPQYNNFNMQNITPEMLAELVRLDIRINPALEISPREMKIRLDTDTELENFGYKIYEKKGAVYLEMPSHEALIKNLHAFKEKHHINKYADVFNIKVVKEDSGDKEFSLDQLTGAVLSLGLQCCHDHHIHLTSRLCRYLKGKSYFDQSERGLILEVYKMYQKIYIATQQNPDLKNQLPKLYFLLGAVTDNLFSFATINYSKHQAKATRTDVLTKIFKNKGYNNSIIERFPNQPKIHQELSELWQKVKDEYKQFMNEKYFAKLAPLLGNHSLKQGVVQGCCINL